jgi:hypothetical protein
VILVLVVPATVKILSQATDILALGLSGRPMVPLSM